MAWPRDKIHSDVNFIKIVVKKASLINGLFNITVLCKHVVPFSPRKTLTLFLLVVGAKISFGEIVPVNQSLFVP